MPELEIYAALVREFEPMLRGYVASLVRDRALADDITQEAFVLAYRNFSSLRKTTSFGAWIRSIARHAAWRELSKRKREIPWDPEVIAGMEDILSIFDDPVRGDTWRERLGIVRACYEQLAQTLKEPCRHFYFERRATATIAEMLRAAPATIRKRLERARIAIKDCVEARLGLEAAE
ncbi:MAG: sigma-70 family RNA polymerase sigma factor [Kiritimatiellae bacterium]|nr:sigma-70 family RNA polymerase sigma factor [Kiritimatiellia bacterium]